MCPLSGRFAQRFEDTPVEFGQLVEEEDAVVREGDFAGARRAAAADQCDGRCGVVRAAIDALGETLRPELSGQREDGCRFERGTAVERWQQAGQACGEHGLAAARRAGHQERVAAGGGDPTRA